VAGSIEELWKLHAYLMVKDQNSSVRTFGHWEIAWRRMVPAVCVITPICLSATPFCQCPPTAQKVRSWRLPGMTVGIDPQSRLHCLL